MTVRNFALTYPQFMSQAITAGKSERDLLYLRKAYETAERLFDGLYRGQHVPFVCHAVRTASILLVEKASIEVIAASLLHAAYTVGCFDDFRHGKATEVHREEIRQAIGAEAESLIVGYDRFLWYEKECIQVHLDQLEQYTEREKSLILIRLANELDDYLDLGMAYRGAFPYQEKIEAYGNEIIEIAKRLGHPILANELRQVFDTHLSICLPETVKTNQKLSYQLPALKWLKKSYLEKLQIKGIRFFQNLGKSDRVRVKEFISGKN